MSFIHFIIFDRWSLCGWGGCYQKPYQHINCEFNRIHISNGFWFSMIENFMFLSQFLLTNVFVYVRTNVYWHLFVPFFLYVIFFFGGSTPFFFGSIDFFFHFYPACFFSFLLGINTCSKSNEIIYDNQWQQVEKVRFVYVPK